MWNESCCLLLFLTFLNNVSAHFTWKEKEKCRFPRSDVVIPKDKHLKKSNKKSKSLMKHMNCTLHSSDFIAWGQNNEGELFFRNTPLVNRGIFIEMGALDGLTFSNTFIFEYCFGWTGVLIEGNPHNFLRLLENRPCNSNVWAVACPSNQSHAFMEGKLGTSKLVDSNSPYVPYKMTMVPCRTLASVFNDNGISHVDFFSLDVEGAELKVLETIDFGKVSIRVLVVEKNGLRKQLSAHDIERSQAIDDLMAKAGMVKVPNDGTQIPECQRKRKGMTVNHFNLFGSDIFVHPSLRDDIC